MTSIETHTFDKVVSSFDGTVYFEDGSTLEISSAVAMGFAIELQRDTAPEFISYGSPLAIRENFHSEMRMVLKFPQKDSAGSIVTYRHTEAVELGMEIV